MPRIVPAVSATEDLLDPYAVMSRGIQMGAENEIRQKQLQIQQERHQASMRQADEALRQSRAGRQQQLTDAQALSQMAGQMGGDPELVARLSPRAMQTYMGMLEQQAQQAQMEQLVGTAQQRLADLQEGAMAGGVELGQEEAELIQQAAQAVQAAETPQDAERALASINRIRVGLAQRVDEEQEYPKAVQRTQQSLEQLEALVGSDPEAQEVLAMARQALLLAGVMRGVPPSQVGRTVWNTIRSGQMPQGLADVAGGAPQQGFMGLEEVDFGDPYQHQELLQDFSNRLHQRGKVTAQDLRALGEKYGMGPDELRSILPL